MESPRSPLWCRLPCSRRNPCLRRRRPPCPPSRPPGVPLCQQKHAMVHRGGGFALRKECRVHTIHRDIFINAPNAPIGIPHLVNSEMKRDARFNFYRQAAFASSANHDPAKAPRDQNYHKQQYVRITHTPPAPVARPPLELGHLRLEEPEVLARRLVLLSLGVLQRIEQADDTAPSKGPRARQKREGEDDNVIELS